MGDERMGLAWLILAWFFSFRLNVHVRLAKVGSSLLHTAKA